MNGQSTEVAPGSGHRVQIALQEAECEMGLLARNFSSPAAVNQE
jgi:hypothetical protein